MAIAPIEVKKSAPARNTALEPWQSFRQDMDRLFDRFTTGFSLPSFSRTLRTDWEVAAPAVDVGEDEKAYTVTAELPGIEEKDLDVTVTGDVLVLKGEKKQEKEETNKNYYLSERSYGSFQRSFALPDGIDRNKISAGFSKGVLTVTLPKSVDSQKQQKKIEIKAA